jgi:ABC-type sulfate/molybdate transport systems ATPase subunit
VALAVLTARWPELWLLDEPHAGLDSAARRILDALLAEAGAGGTTVVIASHEGASIEHLAHRVVTMAGGRVSGERTVPRDHTAPGERAVSGAVVPVGGSMSDVA